MLYQIYKYFEPDIITIFNKPMVQVDKPAPEKTKIYQVQKVCLNRNYRQQNI